MPYISYDEADSLVKEKLISYGIPSPGYGEDPMILPFRYEHHALRVEYCGEKDGTTVVIQLFFDFANGRIFRKHNRITRDGSPVSHLKNIVVLMSRPDFSEDSYTKTIDLGGFNINLHMSTPKSIAAMAAISRENSIEEMSDWIDKVLAEGNSKLLESAAMFTLMNAVVDGDASDIFSEDNNVTKS